MSRLVTAKLVNISDMANFLTTLSIKWVLRGDWRHFNKFFGFLLSIMP